VIVFLSLEQEDHRVYKSTSHITKPYSNNDYTETTNESTKGANQEQVCFVILAASCFIAAAITHNKDK
jgi:hypothetical protein